MEDTEAMRSEITDEVQLPVGLWECLNDPRNCTIAAPDPRTPATLFEGPTQNEVRETKVVVACPSCKGEKVLYRGTKSDAAVAA